MGRAVSSPGKVERQVSVPVEHTTWGDWEKQHPETKILSRDTSYERDYGRSPYVDYEENGDIFFLYLSEAVSTIPKSG